MKELTKETILNLEERYRAKLINSLSGFKSANLIGTKNNGQSNLSIVSSAVHLGATPPLMGIVFRPDTVPRHTLENIRETKYATLNHVNSNIFESAHQTSARYPKEESEFLKCQLSEEYLTDIDIPFVRESKIKVLLKYLREIPIEENGTHFLIFSVEKIFIDEKFISEDGHIEIEKAKTVCVSGLDSYHSTSKLARMMYAKPN